jgi:hypothetical protein
MFDRLSFFRILRKNPLYHKFGHGEPSALLSQAAPPPARCACFVREIAAPRPECSGRLRCGTATMLSLPSTTQGPRWSRLFVVVSVALRSQWSPRRTRALHVLIARPKFGGRALRRRPVKRGIHLFGLEKKTFPNSDSLSKIRHYTVPRR